MLFLFKMNIRDFSTSAISDAKQKKNKKIKF